MNRTVFSTVTTAPAANAVNAAGGAAYSLPAQERLATLAAVGTFGSGFYTGADQQLADVLMTAVQCDPKFVAQCAVYCRKQGKLKDMPALLTASLLVRGDAGRQWAEAIFPQVIDNGKQLRNFVQIIRSGVVGRKSLGTAPKRMIRNWFASRTPSQIWYQSIGTSPTMADVIKLARPVPTTESYSALYSHLIGKLEIDSKLPEEFHALKRWRESGGSVPKGVPWETLVSHAATEAHWVDIAHGCTWTQLRMNLNTFGRHGVYKKPLYVSNLAQRLADPVAIRKSNILPYQLLVAYQNSTEVPVELRNALQAAMEVACENVPALGLRVVVCPDVSGSMNAPVTGSRGTATTAARCIDVASLIASALARKNPNAVILPFSNGVFASHGVNAFDSIMTNSDRLARLGGGGTACAAPLGYMNANGIQADLVIYASDNESWQQYNGARGGNTQGTDVAQQWLKFKRRNPKAKLVCIDLAVNPTVQISTDRDVLNIGGFSDDVFTQIEKFARGDLTAASWSSIIGAVEI